MPQASLAAFYLYEVHYLKLRYGMKFASCGTTEIGLTRPPRLAAGQRPPVKAI